MWLKYYLPLPIDERIAGKTPSTALSLYQSVYTSSTDPTSILWNTNCWASDIDLTCHSPWNNVYKNECGPTWITNSHLIVAGHVGIGVNDRVAALDSSGNITIHTVTASVDFRPTYDARVLTVGEPATNITPCQFAPQDWGTTLRVPNTVVSSNPYEAPSVYIRKDKKLYIGRIRWMCGAPSYQTALNAQSVDPARSQWFSNIVSGDSGHPIFILVYNRLILIGLVGGTHFSDRRMPLSDIEAITGPLTTANLLAPKILITN